MRLGEHSLSHLDWTEQIRRSGFSATHPNYQGALQSHDSDLRLLRLRTPVLLTRSVCTSSGSTLRRVTAYLLYNGSATYIL